MVGASSCDHEWLAIEHLGRLHRHCCKCQAMEPVERAMTDEPAAERGVALTDGERAEAMMFANAWAENVDPQGNVYVKNLARLALSQEAEIAGLRAAWQEQINYPRRRSVLHDELQRRGVGVMDSTVYQIRVSLTEGPPHMRWSAIYDNTYDGAPDSGNRGHMGWGATKAEAVADLLENYEP